MISEQEIEELSQELFTYALRKQVNPIFITKLIQIAKNNSFLYLTELHLDIIYNIKMHVKDAIENSKDIPEVVEFEKNMDNVLITASSIFVSIIVGLLSQAVGEQQPTIDEIDINQYFKNLDFNMPDMNSPK